MEEETPNGNQITSCVVTQIPKYIVYITNKEMPRDRPKREEEVNYELFLGCGFAPNYMFLCIYENKSKLETRNKSASDCCI